MSTDIDNLNLEKDLLFVKKLIDLFSPTIIIMNYLAGIVGGIWLVLLGSWEIVLLGVIASLFMPSAYSLFFLPSLGIMAWAANDIEKNRKIPVIRLFLANFWQNFIIVFWILSVYGFYINSNNSLPLLPLILSAYSTSISPLIYMARKETPDSFGTFIGLFYAELLALFMFISILLNIPQWIRSLFLYITFFM